MSAPTNAVLVPTSPGAANASVVKSPNPMDALFSFFKGGKEIARVKGPQKPLVAKLAKEHAEPIAE